MALNLLLIVALGAIVWQARVRWNDAKEKRRANLSVQVKPVAPPPLPPAPKPDSAAAAKYADVATKNLFSKDRNPNVVIDPPKVEAPKPMPPLPIVYGVLGLPSGTKAIMSEKKGEPGKAVHEGDTIGEFRIAALDPQNVTFDWDGKQISKKIEDLIDRSGPASQGGAQPAAAPAAPAAAPPPKPQSAQPVAAGPGPGGACVPGDTSPSGTVVGGLKKNSVATPFGAMCSWVPVQ
jgi:hypothetical protein